MNNKILYLCHENYGKMTNHYFFIIIIIESINQNHFSLCLYIFNKHFINNKIIKWKIHNNDVKKTLINNIYIMIHYNHIEILPKKVCDVGAHFVKDRALFWVAIVATCDVILEAHCTKFVRVGLAMINDNIRQNSKTISNDDNIHSSLFTTKKRWETSFNTWVKLFDVMVAMVSRNISWVTMRSFLREQHNKWIPKSSMVWHHERCGTVGCGIPRRIQSVVRKWAKDKWNERVLGQINN